MNTTIIYYIIAIFVIYKIFRWLIKNIKPTDVIADFEDTVQTNTSDYKKDLSYSKDKDFGEKDNDLWE
jgi:hypothetical protein